jgi:hypothetical protein
MELVCSLTFEHTRLAPSDQTEKMGALGVTRTRTLYLMSVAIEEAGLGPDRYRHRGAAVQRLS